MVKSLRFIWSCSIPVRICLQPCVWLGLSCFSCALWNRRLSIIERTFFCNSESGLWGNIYMRMQNTSRVWRHSNPEGPSSTQCPDLTACFVDPRGTDFGCIFCVPPADRAHACDEFPLDCVWSTTHTFALKPHPKRLSTHHIIYILWLSLSKLSPIGLPAWASLLGFSMRCCRKQTLANQVFYLIYWQWV